MPLARCVGTNPGTESVEVELRPAAPLAAALSRIFRPWISITAAFASRSRWTQELDGRSASGFLSRLSSGPTMLALAVSSSKVSRDRLPPPSSSGSAGPSSAKYW